MDISTIDALLSNMGLESYIGKFHEEAIDLDLLKDLTDLEMKEILQKIGMKAGEEMKIRKLFQHMKEQGKELFETYNNNVII